MTVLHPSRRRKQTRSPRAEPGDPWARPNKLELEITNAVVPGHPGCSPNRREDHPVVDQDAHRSRRFTAQRRVRFPHKEGDNLAKPDWCGK